jgi:adsorption protein A
MGVVANAQMQIIELPLSGHALVLAEKAGIALQQGDQEQAKILLKEALRLRPDARRIRSLWDEAQKKRLSTAKTQRQTRSVSSKPVQKAHAILHPAIMDAQSVYDLLKAGNTTAALSASASALSKSPNDQRLLIAHVNALIASAQLEDAVKAIEQHIKHFGMNDTLLMLRESTRKQISVSATYAAYRSLEKNDIESAVRSARESIEFAPDAMENRLLLIDILMRNHQFSNAEKAASEAIEIDPLDVQPLMLRGYIFQHMGQRAAALTDFNKVLQDFELATSEKIYFRIIMADAALAADAPQEALNILEPLRKIATVHSKAIVTQRWREARYQLLAQSQGVLAPNPTLQPLVLPCRTSPYGRECNIFPSIPRSDPAYERATEAYAAMKEKNYPLALRSARNAVALDPDTDSYQNLLLSTLVLTGALNEANDIVTKAIDNGKASASMLVQRGDIRSQLGQKKLAEYDFSEALKLGSLPLTETLSVLTKMNRKDEARELLGKSLQSGNSPVASDLDLAYLAITVGDDQIANDAFDRSELAGTLSGLALQNAAYLSMRVGRDQKAINYFERAVDDIAQNTPLELQDTKQIQSLLNIRRTLAELSRDWGANASITLRDASPTVGGTNNTASLQTGTETYWRPLGYRNGKMLELYARTYETPYANAGGLTGSASTTGSVGGRWQPFSAESLVLSMGYLFPVGSQVKSDWLADVSYFKGFGGEVRIDVPSWWTQQYTAEIGHFAQIQQTFATASARLGRSYRLDDISPDLVAFPHFVWTADYNSAYAVNSASDIGAAINFRYWHRQDKYHANRSYVDLSLQQRTKLRPNDPRAKETTFTLLFTY